jgi:hypothetical protein
VAEARVGSQVQGCREVTKSAWRVRHKTGRLDRASLETKF